jgi:AraC-like DNA-binding protein/quercetin dioxygenase-like cupin family protein
MARTRQTLISRTSLDGTVLVRTFGVTFTSSRVLAVHTHQWDQLTYATEGVLSVKTAQGTWVVPPHRAVWVPAGLEHTEVYSGPVKARSLFVVPQLSKFDRRECTGMNVSPLLRELILTAISIGALDSAITAQRRLIEVILDQFDVRDTVPLQLRTPSDPRAVRVAAMLEADPASTEPLHSIAKRAGASTRTIERLFRSEAGVSFQQWRQRLRLIHALRLLAAGESVTNVALEVGYASTSAFIAMFRRELHTTPRRIGKQG